MKNYPRVLYHGTDRKVLLYSTEKRQAVAKLCESISGYLYQKFTADGLDFSHLSEYKKKVNNLLGDDCYRLFDAYQKYSSYRHGSELYQYDSLYVTNNWDRAARFARNGFIMGERGYVAYSLFNSALKIWDLHDGVTKEMEDTLTHFEMLSKLQREPVILSFVDVPENDLFHEDGKPINWDSEEKYYLSSDTVLNFRVAQSSRLTFDDATIEYL